MTARKVLFVCFGNLCRSPMAAGFLNASVSAATARAESAGVRAVDGAAPSLLAVLEMKRRGVDITAHRARNISAVDPGAFDTVIAMDREVGALFSAAHPRLKDFRIWKIPDPYGSSAGRYLQAADVIQTNVEDLLREIQSSTPIR
jgi:protein-tyrosine phosphatase